jgi:glycosyltransferase involved in cell wall biosynthesis
MPEKKKRRAGGGQGAADDRPVDVSVIVPTYNEERFIGRCLRSLAASRTALAFEVLVMDGGSEDGTRREVEEVRDELAQRGGGAQIRLLDNPERRTPFAFNRGLDAARGAYVAILGAHSEVPDGWLQASYDAITAAPEDVMLAGGRIVNALPEGDGGDRFAEAIGYVIGTFWGGGVSPYRYSSKRQFVDTVMFGIYRREVFDAVGRFDTEFLIGQDGELSERIRKAGYRILFDPAIESRYFARRTWPRLVEQMWTYGVARSRMMRRHRRVRLVHLAPLGFAAYLVCLPGLACVCPLNSAPLGAWALATAAYSLGRPSTFAHNFACYATIHAVFGAGMIAGLLPRRGKS